MALEDLSGEGVGRDWGVYPDLVPSQEGMYPYLSFGTQRPHDCPGGWGILAPAGCNIPCLCVCYRDEPCNVDPHTSNYPSQIESENLLDSYQPGYSYCLAQPGPLGSLFSDVGCFHMQNMALLCLEFELVGLEDLSEEYYLLSAIF